MLTQNALHYSIRGVHHWFSIANFFTDSPQTFHLFSSSSVFLLCISFSALHLCTTSALSVDANLRPSFSHIAPHHHHHQHFPEGETTGEAWSVDGWWQDRVLEDRQQKNAKMTRPHFFGRSSRPFTQIRVEDFLDEEDGIDTAESIPSKRHWPSTNAVHFPPFSRVDSGDLDSAESTERKSSTEGEFP